MSLSPYFVLPNTNPKPAGGLKAPESFLSIWGRPIRHQNASWIGRLVPEQKTCFPSAARGGRIKGHSGSNTKTLFSTPKKHSGGFYGLLTPNSHRMDGPAPCCISVSSKSSNTPPTSMPGKVSQGYGNRSSPLEMLDALAFGLSLFLIFWVIVQSPGS